MGSFFNKIFLVSEIKSWVLTDSIFSGLHSFHFLPLICSHAYSDSNHLPVCDCERLSQAQLVSDHEDSGFHERLLAIEDWEQLHDRIDNLHRILRANILRMEYGETVSLQRRVQKAVSGHLGCRPGPGAHGGDEKLSVSGYTLKVKFKDYSQVGYGLWKKRGVRRSFEGLYLSNWNNNDLINAGWLSSQNYMYISLSLCICRYLHTHTHTGRRWGRQKSGLQDGLRSQSPGLWIWWDHTLMHMLCCRTKGAFH